MLRSHWSRHWHVYSTFALSLFFGFLLHLVYPYGFVYLDTYSYLELAKNFQLLWPNALDWWRTVPYGFVLIFALKFAQPTVFLYWLQMALFSINIGLAAILGSTIFRSRRTGFWLALILLLIEVARMRTFFFATEMMTDPFYADVMLMGVLLNLIGWMKQRRGVIYSGFLLLGIAAFTRPVGISLFPVWILFALAVFFRDTEAVWKRKWFWKPLIICTILLLGPIGFWSLRNGIVYGYIEPTAFGPHELLAHTLPLVDDGDSLLPDAAQNEAFITLLRNFEANVGGKRQIYYAWFNDAKNPGPFQYLQSLTPSYQASGGTVTADTLAEIRFETEAIAMQVARRIVLQHPLDYASMLIGNYIELFSGRPALDPDSIVRFRADPQQAYLALTDPQIAGHLATFYPPAGKPDLALRNRGLAQVFESVCCSQPVTGVLRVYSYAKPLLDHLLGMGVLVMLALWITGKKALTNTSLHLAVAISMLLLTAASNYALTVVTEDPLQRYVLPGEMSMHLAWLLVVAALVVKYWNRKAERWAGGKEGR